MPWELEVSDSVGSWGAYGKVYRPGIYTITNELVAAAAREQGGITVREVAEAGEQITYPDAAALPSEPGAGPLTSAEMLGKTPQAEWPCLTAEDPAVACTVKPFRSQKALDAHMERVHPGWEPPAEGEVLEEDPEASPFSAEEASEEAGE